MFMFTHKPIVTDGTSPWAWLGSRLCCAIMVSMTEQHWPDALMPPTHENVAQLLRSFWRELAHLPHLLARDEYLLAAACTAALRRCVLEMMLALNGIAYPLGTTHLNTYLGASQRAALEKTLLAPSAAAESWIGQAVALVVIYRWYAPQLVAAFALPYDEELEAATLAPACRLARLAQCHHDGLTPWASRSCSR